MTPEEKWLLEEKYGGKRTVEYERDTKRLAKGEPLAYVIGWQLFLGLKIYLDSKPLIPRPETEWWTEQLLEEVGSVISGASASDGERHEQIFSRKLCAPRNHTTDFRFLDLCAGSGAIGCAALAQLPNFQVFFGEIDPAHEATILKNIRENNLQESRAHVRIGDLFEPFRATNFSCPYSDLEKWKYSCGDMKFDLIAINPPYIPADRVLPVSVSHYEPGRALYAGPDGLDVIRRIAEDLPQYLATDGEAWIECDSAHASDACALFTAQSLSAKIRTDQYGKPRIIVVSFPRTPKEPKETGI
ncbi:MAG: RsmD family RNA methyltransferase [bacterium]|nr:RsmD family RNA methyltransferase [bacterium]